MVLPPPALKGGRKASQRKGCLSRGVPVEERRKVFQVRKQHLQRPRGEKELVNLRLTHLFITKAEFLLASGEAFLTIRFLNAENEFIREEISIWK